MSKAEVLNKKKALITIQDNMNICMELEGSKQRGKSPNTSLQATLCTVVLIQES